MNNIWRFTGPPENWITALGINNWALNENNKGLWQNKIQPGDTVIFHSTKKSEFSNKTKSCVIGFGYVGAPLTVKDEKWWLQETRDNENYWPYVVPLKEVYLFSDISNINIDKAIQNKDPKEIVAEIEILTQNGIEISKLNKESQKLNQKTPQFPVNGSASGINEIYEDLILNQNQDFFSRTKISDESVLERKLAENLDEKLSILTKEQLLSQAKDFDNSDSASHAVKYGEIKVRKENQIQKRRVAKIENYSCQVCGFKCQYKRRNGKQGWIIHVDHIVEKADGGNEKLNNLWVLCPNCHAKKTYGVIVIDLKEKKVFENGKEITISDNHLFD